MKHISKVSVVKAQGLIEDVLAIMQNAAEAILERVKDKDNGES
jgi:hypothetical protein